MRIIVDSGSTKTDWRIVTDDGYVCDITTHGINPAVQDSAHVLEVVAGQLAGQLLAHGLFYKSLDGMLHTSDSTLLYIYYYGAGCIDPFSDTVVEALSQTFGENAHIEVATDLLGAARALCQHEEGIACILGTGSNSCLYDGERIVMNTPPLGYILGDEGSGAVLGRKFLSALFKGCLPETLREEYVRTTGMDKAEVIAEVYRGTSPNRFLASVSHFVAQHIAIPELRDMVVGNFRDFFRVNVVRYGRPDLPIGTVGSVAYVYRDLLQEAATAEGLTMGKIVCKPLDGLSKYHAEY